MDNVEMVRDAFIEGYKRGFRKGVRSVKNEVNRTTKALYELNEELLFDESQDYIENYVDNDDEPNYLIYGLNF
jgi:hypothetical protein